MKNKTKFLLIFLVSLVSFSFIFIIYYSTIIDLIKNVFLLLLSQQFENRINFAFFLILLNFVYFLTPLPVTPLILFNGFIIGLSGFFFSIFFISLGTVLIFIFTKFFLKKNLSKLPFSKYLKSYVNKYDFIKKPSNFSIFLSRFIVPYFFHNVLFGFYDLKLIRFYLIALAANIPATFALNSIGMSLTSFILVENYGITDLFLNLNFILPLLFVFIIILFSGVIKGIIISKNN